MKRVAVATALICLLFLVASCAKEWNCSSGRCRFEHNATGCTTREAYERLKDEFSYANETGDTTRISYLYSGGLCKRFPQGTIVHILEGGIFTVKVRFVHLSSEPDRWMSAEMLRRVKQAG